MFFDRLFKLILLLTVFLAPLIGVVGDFGFEQSKVLFFILAVILAGGVWVIRDRTCKTNWSDKTYLKIIALIFILALGITSLKGLNPEISFFGSFPYFQGWILYLMMFLFALMISSSGLKLRQVGIFLTASAVIVSLFAIKDYISLTFFEAEIPTYAGRVVSTFGQPNFYAGFLLLTLPFSLKLSHLSHLSRLRILSNLLIILGILISGSRIAIGLGFMVLALWFIDKYIKNIWTVLILGAIFLIIILGIILKTGFIYKEIIEPKSLENTAYIPEANSVEKRYYLWPLYWKIAGESPFLGYGLENITNAHQNYFKDNNHDMFEIRNQPSVVFRLRSLVVDRTHNYILDLLMFSGILGLLTYGLLICLMIKNVKSKTLLAALLIYLVWSAFQNQSIVQLMFFWLMVGLIDKEIPI